MNRGSCHFPIKIIPGVRRGFNNLPTNKYTGIEKMAVDCIDTLEDGRMCCSIKDLTPIITNSRRIEVSL